MSRREIDEPRRAKCARLRRFRSIASASDLVTEGEDVLSLTQECFMWIQQTGIAHLATLPCNLYPSVPLQRRATSREAAPLNAACIKTVRHSCIAKAHNGFLPARLGV
jgi:hypothetical protein